MTGSIGYPPIAWEPWATHRPRTPSHSVNAIAPRFSTREDLKSSCSAFRFNFDATAPTATLAGMSLSSRGERFDTASIGYDLLGINREIISLGTKRNARRDKETLGPNPAIVDFVLS
jgi:hypothetical protein